MIITFEHFDKTVDTDLIESKNLFTLGEKIDLDTFVNKLIDEAMIEKKKGADYKEIAKGVLKKSESVRVFYKSDGKRADYKLSEHILDVETYDFDSKRERTFFEKIITLIEE